MSGSSRSVALTMNVGRHQPSGMVPAFVDNRRLIIESIDIIRHIAGEATDLATTSSPELLQMADDAQLDLKLLTFEFLFRAGPPPSEEDAEAFQRNHRNEWLKQFRKDFAAGFDRERIDAAVRRTDAGFRKLNDLLSDGRAFLQGDTFSLADIAWMPNVHRFSLMSWPFERTPHLRAWFDRVSKRPSYKTALLDWQNEHAAGAFAAYKKNAAPKALTYAPLEICKTNRAGKAPVIQPDQEDLR